MLLYVIYAFIAIAVMIFLVIHRYTQNARKQVINVHTKQPITEYSSNFESLYHRVVRKQHQCFLALKRAQRYNFRPYLSFFLHFKILMVNDPKLAKKVLLNWRVYEKQQTQSVSPFPHIVFGNNVVFANGDEWRMQRAVMNPAFFSVDRFIQIFSQKATECMDDMAKKCNASQTVHVPSFMTALALDILGTTVFGYDFEYLKEMTNKELGLPTNDKKLHVIDAYDHMMNYMFSVMQHIGGKRYTDLKLPGNEKFRASVATIENLIYSVIDQSRKRIENGEQCAETLLDMMVASVDDETKRGMDQKTLRDNAIVMFIAGHDTTSTALSYELYNLGKFPEMQEKIFYEIAEKIPSDRDATAEEIDSLEYLTMFIKESLRMYPPVTGLPARVLTQTETLGDYSLAKGSRVAISIYAIHHNSNVWDNPSEFRPERFTEENNKKRPSTAWMPFGSGPRACLGQRFSLLEQKVFLVALLKRYQVVLPDMNYVAKPTKMSFLFGPPKDLEMILKKRK